jgi:hypothetical protein
MPSASATRPTSMTDSCIALRTATAASGPCLRAIPFEAGGNSAEHQPPLRPEAPNPVISRSTIAIQSAGSSSWR